MMVDKNKPTDLINDSKKDDLPYMPFYVGDWLKAPDIQCLSYELKGLWFEMLCYMWESKERGVLIKANGAPYTIAEVSRLLRLPEVLLKQKLKQLLEFAIYSIRESDGAIYSRRMVKDQRIRKIRKKAGSKGGKNSFASRFAQAKTQANTENDIDNESVPVIKGNGKGKEIVKYAQLFPNNLINPEFIEAWVKWIEFNDERDAPIKATQAKEQLKYLASIEKPVEKIELSIKNNWKGLHYAISKGNNRQSKNYVSPERVEDDINKMFSQK